MYAHAMDNNVLLFFLINFIEVSIASVSLFLLAVGIQA